MTSKVWVPIQVSRTWNSNLGLHRACLGVIQGLHRGLHRVYIGGFIGVIWDLCRVWANSCAHLSQA